MKKLSWMGLFLIIFFGFSFAYFKNRLTFTNPLVQTNVSQPNYVKVERVIDGDTIVLTTGQKVRYIGIDTPEIVDPNKPIECFGKEAMVENQKLVEGKTVRLEKDISEMDKYGRLLRYVYVENIMVNSQLVQTGFAKIMSIPPDIKYYNILKLAQSEAKNNHVGLWNICQNNLNNKFEPTETLMVTM
jgi:micrococcal nuclease